MKAIGYQTPQEIEAETALVDIELPKPQPLGRDILVEVKAISVNPVDTKVRASRQPKDGAWEVLGYDAAGVVAEVGPDTKFFKPGDAVFYAGAINRSGTNAQFHLVDERIVGTKPDTLDFASAAALPLTSITAYEALLERLDVKRPVPGAANAIVIIGGAGGVGSIAIQIARALTDLTVIATASRPETQAWVQDLGAHHVIDHRQPIAPQIKALGIGQPGFVFSTTNTDDHIPDIVELLAPQGRFGLIDDPKELNAAPLKSKSISLHWELMFTRSLFGTADIERQHELLDEVSKLVDAGKIKTTLAENFGAINAENLKRAHALVESGKSKGKVVLSGF
ncbi:zinc-binding alcohol dehydrogenase family protein [Pelagibacterium sp.]|uniref:zinc-binding alcohol dehydrogenase family protein n=1 Tax=Pelagibacterium sp. TaxID=1967288 RepID=UPI003A91B509